MTRLTQQRAAAIAQDLGRHGTDFFDGALKQAYEFLQELGRAQPTAQLDAPVTSPDKAEPPHWYTTDEARGLLARMKVSASMADEMSGWLATHLQLAFNKGHQIGRAAPIEASEKQLFGVLNATIAALDPTKVPRAAISVAHQAGLAEIAKRRVELVNPVPLPVADPCAMSPVPVTKLTDAEQGE